MTMMRFRKEVVRASQAAEQSGLRNGEERLNKAFQPLHTCMLIIFTAPSHKSVGAKARERHIHKETGHGIDIYTALI